MSGIGRTENGRDRGWVSVVAAMLLAGCVLLPLLGHRPLTDWDEGIYAEVSREMLGGSWWVPHWNYQVWLEKPPLTLWITALFFRLFGVTEFWARAGSAFGGIAIVGWTHRWALRRRNPATAWLATVILLAGFGFQHICRAGEMDTLLTLGCCVAVGGLSSVSTGRLQGWFWFWGGFAIAAMSKGAASVVLLLTLVSLIMIGRWWQNSLGWRFYGGVVVFFSLVLPWHGEIWNQYGPRFIHEYLAYHVLNRALHPIENHPTHWWFYFWVLLVSAPPFALFYPSAIQLGFKRVELRPWAVFSLIVVIFYSIIRTRLPHYVAPIYPAMAILTAIWIAELAQQHLQSRRAWITLSAIFITGYGVGSALTSGARRGLHRARDGEGAGQTVAQERESISLLKGAQLTGNGPLLVWHERMGGSIATQVFYARRPVIQVGPAPPEFTGWRYSPEPKRLKDLVAGPELLLIDRELLHDLPSGFEFQPIAGSEQQVVGIVR